MAFQFCQSIFLLLLSFLGENKTIFVVWIPSTVSDATREQMYGVVSLSFLLPNLWTYPGFHPSLFPFLLFFFPPKRSRVLTSYQDQLLYLCSPPSSETLLFEFPSLNCIFFFYWVLPHACPHTLGCPVLPKETPWPLDLLSLFSHYIFWRHSSHFVVSFFFLTFYFCSSSYLSYTGLLFVSQMSCTCTVPCLCSCLERALPFFFSCSVPILPSNPNNLLLPYTLLP